MNGRFISLRPSCLQASFGASIRGNAGGPGLVAMHTPRICRRPLICRDTPQSVARKRRPGATFVGVVPRCVISKFRGSRGCFWRPLKSSPTTLSLIIADICAYANHIASTTTRALHSRPSKTYFLNILSRWAFWLGFQMARHGGEDVVGHPQAFKDVVINGNAHLGNTYHGIMLQFLHHGSSLFVSAQGTPTGPGQLFPKSVPTES